MAKKKAAGITELKDGRLQARFTVNGHRFVVYGHSVKECREKELEKRQEIEEGAYKQGKALTVDEFFERWITAKESCVKSTTLRSNRMMYRNISSCPVDDNGDRFGTLKVKDVEAENVRSLQAELRKTRSTRTVNDSISFLRGIFNAAIAERVTSYNPCLDIRPLRRTEEKARDNIHRALTREETQKFMQGAANEWYYPLFRFLLNTGCRIGEAGALRRGDVGQRVVHIRRTITRTEEGGYIIGDDTKTAAGRRDVPLNDAARDAIARQQATDEYFDGLVDLNKPIFRAPEGGLLKSNVVNDVIARVCDAVGVERFTVHAFRATFCTRAVESGMRPKVLQEIMGHSDIEMTLGLYSHAMDDQKQEQLLKVSF